MPIIPLIAFGILPDDTNQNAINHANYIRNILAQYNREINSLLFITADNTALNPAVATLLHTMFIGCYSHRLNLANRACHMQYEHLLARVHSIMVHFNQSNNNRGRLKQYTDLAPVPRCTTRWSSTYAMLERYLRLHAIIEEHYAELAISVDLLFTAAEIATLRAVRATLDDVDAITVSLQCVDLTMHEARMYFAVVKELELFNNSTHLDPNYTGAAFRDFENGLCKLQEGRHELLTVAEAARMERFLKPAEPVEIVPADHPAAGTPPVRCIEVAQERIRQRREQAQAPSPYVNTSYVQVTSNIAERAFSAAKLVSTPYRNLSPASLETIMMLKCNRALWDVETVANLMKD